MELRYKDYVHRSCDEVFFSGLSVLKPNEMRKPHSFKFRYSMKFCFDKVEAQADCFANEVIRNSALSTIVNKNVQGTPNRKKEVIKDVYIYSYFKAFNMCVTLQETGGEFSGNPGANSTVFRGHAELYRIFYSTFILSVNSGSTNQNTSLYKSLEILDEDIKEFRSTEFYQKYNESRITFFFLNAEFERLLDAFKKFAQMHICIDEFTNKLVPNPDESPLGNVCLFYNDEDRIDELLIINSSSMYTDMNSKFWNLGNCIYLEEGDKRFSRCYMSPYLTTDLKDLDPSSIYAIIEAITGLSCGEQFTQFGFSKPKPDDGDIRLKPTGGKDPSPSKTPKGQDPKGKVDDDSSLRVKRKLPKKPDTKDRIVEGVIGFGKSSFKAIKEVVGDPDIQRVLIKALDSKLENDRKIKTLLVEPSKRVIKKTSIGNQFMPVQREVVTEEVFR